MTGRRSPSATSSHEEVEPSGYTKGAKPRTNNVSLQTTGFADRYAAARPLEFDSTAEKLNHGVFRYPAKFHPPIARKLVELISEEGETILDPFCGSGTLLVEAAASGRNAIGSDVDPLAVFVSRAKTGIISAIAIADAAERCAGWLQKAKLDDEERQGAFTTDIEQRSFEAQRHELMAWIPELPNMQHWFRRRAILQLAAIRRHIQENYSGEGKAFLMLCFASIIRSSSNADPIPVSGLEVTSHMLAKEASGRAVDPWGLMSRAVAKSLPAMKAFIAARRNGVTSAVHLGDARELSVVTTGKVAAVVTSPPYLTAVDYYRRHTLEMYWLGLTNQRTERLALMGRYIGRDRVGENHFPISSAKAEATSVADRWMSRFPGIQPVRERAFRHYCDGMFRALGRMQEIVFPGGAIVIVAGDVRFCGVQVSMLELMNDLAGGRLKISDHLWYPIINRYMSYSRRNEANISADHVLVFRGLQ